MYVMKKQIIRQQQARERKKYRLRGLCERFQRSGEIETSGSINHCRISMTLLTSKELGLASQLLLQPRNHEICACMCLCEA